MEEEERCEGKGIEGKEGVSGLKKDEERTAGKVLERNVLRNECDRLQLFQD